MTRDKARDEILSRWEEVIPEILPRAKKNVKGKPTWICPNCGHGAGGDGIVPNKKSEVHGLICFTCNWTGNIIDLYMKVNGVDYKTAFNALADRLRLDVDRYDLSRSQGAISAGKKPDGEIPTDASRTANQAAQLSSNTRIMDYNDYYMECRKRMSDTAAAAYMRDRGISEQTAALYCVGYDPEWVSPTVVRAQKEKGSDWRPPATKRIILPVSGNHYIARAIDPAVERQYQKMNETGNGDSEIFNPVALFGTDPVFITEGYFDALSIIEVGGSAVALNSTSNVTKLLSLLEQERIQSTLILCLDDDDAGKKATDILKTGLDRLNISHITADICCGCKDPNEALVKDRKIFEAAVRKAQTDTAARPDNVSGYIDTLMAGEIEQFQKAADLKTGFPKLDIKSGGVYPGLYVIAATSSLGKTTFSLQLADNFAASGHDVLFFSMEQSRLELVSKSLARITAQENRETALNSLAIRNGRNPDRVRAAAQRYKEMVGDRMNIIEGNFRCNISFIGEYIRRYIARNGTSPIVFIDYLQILQPEEDQKKNSTKETVDRTVTELKRLSREMDITVFVISSVNRANYLTPIDFEALKESGGIEYTADVIWGLQLQCLNDPLFSETNKISEKREKVRKEKARDPRLIELLCLKNRYGVANFTCPFEYYPQCDLFDQSEGQQFYPCYEENPFEPDAIGMKAGRRR